jgi:hypothetical protein
MCEFVRAELLKITVVKRKRDGMLEEILNIDICWQGFYISYTFEQTSGESVRRVRHIANLDLLGSTSDHASTGEERAAPTPNGSSISEASYGG